MTVKRAPKWAHGGRRRRTIRIVESGKAGEGGARCRHEPRIEAGDRKRRSRQRAAEDDDAEQPEREAERNIVARHGRARLVSGAAELYRLILRAATLRLPRWSRLYGARLRRPRVTTP